MRREEVVHDDEVNLLTIGHLDPVQTVELREKSVGVFGDMLEVVLEDLAKKLMLGMVNGLDDVLVVTREVEETAALARRAKFGQYILARQRHEVICWVQSKACAEMAENPRRVVLKLEVVLGGGNQLVPGTSMMLVPRP